jgi:hypothetical protein
VSFASPYLMDSLPPRETGASSTSRRSIMRFQKFPFPATALMLDEGHRQDDSALDGFLDDVVRATIGLVTEFIVLRGGTFNPFASTLEELER